MTKKAPGEEEEPSFRVTDRRRVGREDSEGPIQASESERPPASPPPPRAETPSPEAESPPDEILPTLDLVRIFVAELQTRALIHMGLIPNPTTRLVAKDLPQARLAIDCVAALVDIFSPSASPEEREELQQMVSNLRLHFVRLSGA
ncbi:MAG: DUF1844 domain-containing protein [Acidobacteriota bacterium]